MKKLVSIFSLLIFMHGLCAQTTAVDWTLTDCSSTTHHLYDYLDSQEVVVMEFSHGCASCTQAASYLMDIKADYDVSHPGKVNWFFMDYNGNDCSAVLSSVSMYNFDAEFINCLPQKDDYYPSIFPMPAIVIAAGNYHTVIFQHQTWLNSDTTEIRNAIDHFFATIGIEDALQNSISMYPNPASDILNINLSNVLEIELEGIEVYDSNGKQMKLVYNTSNSILTLSVGYFPTGNYTIVVNTKKGSIKKSFIKN